MSSLMLLLDFLVSQVLRRWANNMQVFMKPSLSKAVNERGYMCGILILRSKNSEIPAANSHLKPRWMLLGRTCHGSMMRGTIGVKRQSSPRQGETEHVLHKMRGQDLLLEPGLKTLEHIIEQWYLHMSLPSGTSSRTI